MDRITHEVRQAHWTQIIQQCSARPEGMTITQWLADNHVPYKSYYYWPRKLRHAAFEQMQQSCSGNQQSLPAEHQPSEVIFAEIKPPAQEPESTKPGSVPEAIIRIGKAEIEISSSISDQLLARIIRAANYAG